MALNKLEVLALIFPNLTIQIIQQKRKKPTVLFSPKIANYNIDITTHIEGIIREVIYEYWCPISKKFYNHREKSIGDYYFKILKLSQIKHRDYWASSLMKMLWINHIPEGVGLATDEDIFQKAYLSEDDGELEFITVNHSEIADYYQVTAEEIEQIVTQ
jgi:hypothetical protein